jgi:putative aldouronate transport system permease protein
MSIQARPVKKAAPRSRIKTTPGEKLATAAIYTILFILGVITLYPFIYVLSNSLSDPNEVFRMTVKLWPVGFTLNGYTMVLSNPHVWQAYYNTIWYVVVGVAFNIFTTITFAYPLSRKEFTARKYFMVFIAVPMFFSGGMIPSLLLIIQLGLYNTRWALILPGAISIFGTVMARVFFQTTIPDSLVESARIDGANDVKVLVRIVMPLSLPIISVIGLFTAVSYWNMYTPALLYLPSAPKLQPLQVYLQRILIANISDINSPNADTFARSLYAIQLKYSVIMVATLPIICTYPFLQKYFVKGVMVGAIKE